MKSKAHRLQTAENTDKPVRMEIIVSRTFPQNGDPQHIIGYWSEPIRREAEKRGYFPMIKIMWPEDLEVLGSAKAASIAAKVANDNLSKDPLVSALADKVAAALPAPTTKGTESNAPFLMRIPDYAKRLGYSTAHVSRLIAKGLPTLGRHKGRRVHVARADRWLEENLDHLDLTESEDIGDVAKANALKGGK